MVANATKRTMFVSFAFSMIAGGGSLREGNHEEGNKTSGKFHDDIYRQVE
jgi:hypothetical protein